MSEVAQRTRGSVILRRAYAWARPLRNKMSRSRPLDFVDVTAGAGYWYTPRPREDDYAVSFQLIDDGSVAITLEPEFLEDVDGEIRIPREIWKKIAETMELA